MKTKILKFDPRLGFSSDITGASGCVNCGVGELTRGIIWCKCNNPQPKKRQTIRDKPCKVGDRYALWEWMDKKGLYCPKCLKILIGMPYEDCTCAEPYNIIFPRKLLEVEMKDCVEIEMRYIDNSFDCAIQISFSDEEIFISTDPKLRQHPFVKADTPNMTNKEFIDCMLKLWPEIARSNSSSASRVAKSNSSIKKGWKKLWVWKW